MSERAERNQAAGVRGNVDVMETFGTLCVLVGNVEYNVILIQSFVNV